MKLEFSKYQATGNDFIMINNIDGNYDGFNIESIPILCDRKFGIGADGLILIREDKNADFYVDYYNADGTQSFCGNGARCSVAFAKQNGIIKNKTKFNAIDGLHSAGFIDENIKIEMVVSDLIQKCGEDYILNTGSPHYCRFDQDEVDIVSVGRKIRFSDKYKNEGINVNIIRMVDGGLSVQTYERGVEDETLSCGTGVTACALIAIEMEEFTSPVKVQTKGGTLYVEAMVENGIFSNVFLIGPAEFVYGGTVNV